MNRRDVKLSVIRTDGGTQMREELDRALYMEYRDLWKAGAIFPPLDVFHDGSTYWLADGFHRFYGARESGLKTVPCNVHNGTVRDAILFAVGANQANGLRRTNADKRKAVLSLLNDEEWVTWSDREIAEKAGVNNRFVGEVRKELCTVHSSPAAKTADQPRKGKDGKSRKPPKKKPEPAKPEPKAPTSIPFEPTKDDEPDPYPVHPSPKQPRDDHAQLRRMIEAETEKAVIARILFDTCTEKQRASVAVLWNEWWKEE